MKVAVTASMPDEIIGLIRREHEVWVNSEPRPIDRGELERVVTDIDGLISTITDPLDEAMLARAPRLKVIANFGVGFDHIDLEAATRRGILVTNTPGVLTDATADVALALILATARRVVEGDRMVREGRFKRFTPFHFLGHQVSGSTLGIIGLGRIGQAVARRAAGFGMKVLYCRRTRLDPGAEAALGVSFTPMDTLLAESDFVSIHVPLTPETRHLISTREFSLMKLGSYLINTSRGPVVDERALVEALRQGRLAGAGLDVYEDEPRLAEGLRELDSVVLLPHVGSATVETRTRMAQMAVENLLAGLSGKRPPNCLNYGG